MKKILLLTSSIIFCNYVFGQDGNSSTKDTFLKSGAETACKCIDSIRMNNREKDEITQEINKCINKEITAYQIAEKLTNLDYLRSIAKEKGGKKQIDITISTDVNSNTYKKYYYDMERYLMENCNALKKKLATNDKENDYSFSKDPKALEFYEKGINEMAKENYTSSIDYFEKALKIDSKFAFAYDNIGISYRKLGDFDKAIEAYEKSLQIDPKGQMPLQNIAVAYQYKKDYANAIKNYEKLAEIDPKNPEIYYGIGQICTLYLRDYEKALNNLCKAYNIYSSQKSAYRTDAENLIGTVYAEMKKAGNEQRFYEILKENKINVN